LSRDTGADDHGDEEAAAEEFGEEPASEGLGHCCILTVQR
jgi:hypothetical protein